MEIVYCIVDAAKHQPCLKTTLIQRANISYLELGKYLDYVLSQGLLEPNFIDNKVVYLVTPKGFKFLSKYEELQEMIARSAPSTSLPEYRETSHLDTETSEINDTWPLMSFV